MAGQFTSADTTLAGGLNRYAYVGGNPETRTDPTGHMYAQNSHLSYQDFGDFGASVYALISKDKGAANNGMPTALFIALYGGYAYQAALAYGVGHGMTLPPNVGRDAYQYRHTQSNAYWNSSGARMTQYLQLTSLANEYVLLMTGGGGHSDNLNLFNSMNDGVAAAAGNTDLPLTSEPSGSSQLSSAGNIGNTSDEKPTPPALPSGAKNQADFGQRIIQWGGVAMRTHWLESAIFRKLTCALKA